MSEQRDDADKPQRRQQHGLTPAKRAFRKYGTGALDQRTTEAKELAMWKERLTEDLGGPDAVSTQQETVIELAARQIVLLHLIDNWVFAAPEQRVFRRRDKTMYPLTKERQRIADALSRYMAQLGMDKRAPKGRDLSSYLEDRYGGDDEDTDDEEEDS